MRKCVCTVTAAVLTAAFAAGCSDSPQVPLPAGQLSAGAAEITVNGQQMEPAKAVDCRQDGDHTTITTGSADAGTKTILDNSNGLEARSVAITNLAGFTGSYWQDLDGKAEVQQTGRTLLVTGTASGFGTQNPHQRGTATFAIRVAC